ncbi:TIGR04551 family protein [Nannocystis punicea]|uniref:TIGR04551 family protein n=1 Tax=Nannocystis punicea TaxID=2995304 RepID=A0ABY7HA00_9BACT|nr:TIGR04551 family protein [Nannocystis poenicansa]WAS96105.1 TIGR04551 family protein [Nannocystis poenicansa]
MPTSPPPRPHRLFWLIPAFGLVNLFTGSSTAHAQAPMGGGMGMGGMGGGGMGPMGGGGMPGQGGQGEKKKEGPAEAAPKDKKALQPIEPVPAQPRGLRQLQLFELHGYMRMRADYFHRLDLGSGKSNQSTIGTNYADNAALENPYFVPPSVAAETVGGFGEGSSASDVNCVGTLTGLGINASKASRRCGRRNGFASANMRMRIEPTIHVTDTVKVHAQLDALDNLVLGSTPDSLLADNPNAPIDLFTRTQLPPSDMRNSGRDSIVVKRAYGHIRFGWGLDIKFGRMPHHWGMGIVANDGNGYYRGEAADIVRMLDMDYGDSVDSLRLGFDFGKDRRSTHTLEFSWDWASSGPTTAQIFGPFYGPYQQDYTTGQTISVEKFDNVYQWRISILRRDDPAMLQRKLALGRPVVNYGAIVWARYQAIDRVTGTPGIGIDPHLNEQYGSDIGSSGNEYYDQLQDYANILIRRRALVFTPDVWFRVNWKTLRVELEGAAVLGRFNEINDRGALDTAQGNDRDDVYTINDPDMGRRWLTQFGYALEFKYGLFKDKFHLGLDHGFASGDNDPRFRYNTPWNSNLDDRTWSKFRFNPAYFSDLLLFRELLGTASNAAYFKPWLAFYFFDNNFSGRLDIEYAVAPQRLNTWGNKANYGLEIDAAFRYHDRQEPIFFQLQYGVMFPFGAFSRGVEYSPDGTLAGLPNNGDPKAAQTVQAQLGIRF